MAAVALDPKPEWEVIDACSAPGNKTVHLAALMNGKGKIIACELNKERVERLRNTVKLAAATSVEVKHEDFLNLDPTDPSYSKVRAILLDPSCSGSGTAIDRLDHLLPSHTAGQSDHVDEKWLQRLASFQKRVLEHALSCKQQSIACSSHPRQFLLFVICQILPHQNQPTITTRSLNR